MADVRWVVRTGSITTSTSTITLLQIVAASNHRTVIDTIDVGFKGTTATNAPITLQVVRQTTAGTMTSATMVKANASDNETIQTTAQHTATAEPTTTDVLFETQIHPQTDRMWSLPPGREFKCNGGERFGILLVSPANANTATVCASGVE